MKPTEVLEQEHEAIKVMLRVIGRVCQKLESGQAVDQEHLERILEFIKTFTDRCHSGKEEDLLFPAMEKAGVPRYGGPIGVMLEEHTLGRGYVKGMAEALEAYKAGDKQAAARLADNGRKYAALLEQHIDKENNILYPMADMHLSKKRQEELLVEFEKVETERIGVGKHEEFHRLLDHLKDIYLDHGS